VGVMTSVTMGKPVLVRALAINLRAASPIPRKL
jgi:hypothetical protein